MAQALVFILGNNFARKVDVGEDGDLTDFVSRVQHAFGLTAQQVNSLTLRAVAQKPNRLNADALYTASEKELVEGSPLPLDGGVNIVGKVEQGGGAAVVPASAVVAGQSSSALAEPFLLIGQLQEELRQLRRAPRPPDVLVGSPFQALVEPHPQIARILASLITPMAGQVLQLLAIGPQRATWVMWVAVTYLSAYVLYMAPFSRRRQQ